MEKVSELKNAVRNTAALNATSTHATLLPRSRPTSSMNNTMISGLAAYPYTLAAVLTVTMSGSRAGCE